MRLAEMRNTLKDPSNCEARGLEGLPTEAYKYAPLSLMLWLSFFVNADICHHCILSQVFRNFSSTEEQTYRSCSVDGL